MTLSQTQWDFINSLSEQLGQQAQKNHEHNCSTAKITEYNSDDSAQDDEEYEASNAEHRFTSFEYGLTR